jgi:hypothetical protein
MLVGFAAGGAPDIAARLVTQWLSERLGQQFVIENRPGAGGNIATEAVVDAPADGYTLLMAGLQNAVNTTLYQKLKYDFARDMAPVVGVSHENYGMEVHPSSPAKTVPEFIAYAKPTRQTQMASPGNGTGPHMAGELEDHGRRRHGARRLSRLAARVDGSARRTGADDVQPSVFFDRVCENRQASWARGDECRALRRCCRTFQLWVNS